MWQLTAICNSSSRSSDTSSDLCKYQAHTWYTDIMQAKHSHTQNKCIVFLVKEADCNKLHSLITAHERYFSVFCLFNECKFSQGLISQGGGPHVSLLSVADHRVLPVTVPAACSAPEHNQLRYKEIYSGQCHKEDKMASNSNGLSETKSPTGLQECREIWEPSLFPTKIAFQSPPESNVLYAMDGLCYAAFKLETTGMVRTSLIHICAHNRSIHTYTHED